MARSNGDATTAGDGAAPPRLLLERIEPSHGRGERIFLDSRRLVHRLGRAETNEIRLFTVSSSREHAVITRDPGQDWVISPVEGKTLLIDGEIASTTVPLEVGMNLVLGGDQLRCAQDDGPCVPGSSGFVAGVGADRAIDSASRRRPPTSWIVLALGTVVLLALLVRWLAL